MQITICSVTPTKHENDWFVAGCMSPGRENLFCVLDKTLNAHSASLHPGAEVGTDEFNTGVTLR